MTLDALTDPAGYAFVQQQQGWVGNGVADRFEPPTTLDRFARSAEWLSDRLAPDGVAFASFTFDAGSDGSAVAIPEQLVRVDGPGRNGRAELVNGVNKVRYAGASVSEVDWMEAVATATAQIREGRYDKVVLARDLQVWADDVLDPIGLAEKLAARFPSCMTFVHEGFVGATPELLVRRIGNRVESVVLAGTTTPDDAAGQALLASEKDREEHGYAKESARAALAPLCDDLAVDADPWLLRLDNLQHLATRLTGTLREPTHVLELVGALHPTAAVGGTPREVAVPLIGSLEGMDRARYAGPVGVVRGNGDGTFGIALRCAQLTARRARLFAGCGIVAGSLPEAELEETRLKLNTMQQALGARTN